MRRLAVPSAALLFATLVLTQPARADLAAGSVDPTFAEHGTTTLVQGRYSSVHAIGVQPDGKILVAGGAAGFRHGTIAVARYDRRGVLDPTFSENGLVRTRVDNGGDALAVAVQTDGRIVVAGEAESRADRSELVIVRYLPNGSLDRSFGIDGKSRATEIGDAAVSGITGLAFDADGRIVASAFADDGKHYEFGVIRFTSDGSPDPTFSGDGAASIGFRHNDALASSIAVQSDGAIVLAGLVRRDSGSRFAVARFLADGTIDDSFADHGKRTIGFGGAGSGGSDVALQADGKIVVAGMVRHGPPNAYGQQSIAIARLGANGDLDPTFAGDGRRTTTGEGNLSATGVAIQSDGRIVVGGQSTPTVEEYPDDFVVARYRPAGSLDRSFGDHGITVTSILVDDWVEGIAIQPNGKIVAAGLSAGGNFSGGAVARYLP